MGVNQDSAQGHCHIVPVLMAYRPSWGILHHEVVERLPVHAALVYIGDRATLILLSPERSHCMSFPQIVESIGVLRHSEECVMWNAECGLLAFRTRPAEQENSPQFLRLPSLEPFSTIMKNLFHFY